MKKKNAKIFLSVCIVAALLLSACACAQDEGRVQESPGTNTASTKTPSPAPTEQPTPPPTQDAATQARQRGLLLRQPRRSRSYQRTLLLQPFTGKRRQL